MQCAKGFAVLFGIVGIIVTYLNLQDNLLFFSSGSSVLRKAIKHLECRKKAVCIIENSGVLEIYQYNIRQTQHYSVTDITNCFLWLPKDDTFLGI